MNEFLILVIIASGGIVILLIELIYQIFKLIREIKDREDENKSIYTNDINDRLDYIDKNFSRKE